MTFVLEDMACPFGLCGSGNYVLFSDQEKHAVYKLNFEKQSKELFVREEDTAGFGDGIPKEARITLRSGNCNRGRIYTYVKLSKVV